MQQEISGIVTRLRHAASVPDTLAVSLDGFEAIRLLARDGEDRVPGLLAAFMTVADAAVDGRDAVTIAPSLPPPGSGEVRVSTSATDARAGDITSTLAVVGALLRDRLACAATLASVPGDRVACDDAAQAAARICQLMAP